MAQETAVSMLKPGLRLRVRCGQSEAPEQQ
jgi:hypothetical protein